ncbi:glycoside hydrolase N-terminal domain-containing protein [Aureibaculum sp. 2210JD6-5]|uniref:glycoside hydrolase family 95 protein n=1 Tax=Aureibaculum sp. 2210JD6-5 TaxID=3103957 RepID=UPI002AAC996E|nr:glycoside hydrolase N-terminal domain-containing protein [Aureibaculum sp. 2210JD6-5]MDY7395784.1 glycoside hydrolase N-terminal domain-containing protein [Aureibaculum sp. 2210JD6-5]
MLLIFLTLALFSCNNSKTDKELDPSLMLWYDKPAANWTEALPIGNGRLAAMVYGGIEKEVIQFNEETLWTGQPHDYAHENAHEVLGELRQLLWEGKQEEAHKLGNERFMSQPFGQFCYQPFGNVLLDFPDHNNTNNYKRKLDLEDAVSTVIYETENSTIKREVFASEPDQAVVIHIENSTKGELNFNIGLDSPHSKYKVKVEGDEIVLKGKANNYPNELDAQNKPYPESKLTFEARLKVINKGGELMAEENTIKVVNADSATLLLVAATSFINYQDISGNPEELCKKYLSDLNGKSYETLKTDHVKDFSNLFNRVAIDLGKSEISNRSTNERLISFTKDKDPNLVSLFYQYGRYLLISSSRVGTQPANLQGIWNDKLSPPWDSKYTININTEMNYWLAEMTNLSELSEPLSQMVEDLAVTGQNVAKEHYNLDGWVTHHNTDLWRGAAPINGADHGIWPTGGAWLSQHLWWHYQYTYDREYLKNEAYPVLKEASRFFVGYLVPDPKNPEWLVSGSSNSPENGGLVMAPTMDHQIIRNLFANTIEAAEILGVDADFIKTVKEKHAKIAPNLIGKHGQLQEWLIDKDDPENKHRHVSHLWGLHPGNEIHPLTTPDLAEASKVTLSHRGDGGTGWSRAWKINFWARLLDGEHSFLLLRNLMVPSLKEGVDMEDKGGLYLNLLDAHPPFQIDGNFGATAGITEMLLQSHLRDENGDYFQDILPALPSAFPTGKISGIKGRGAFEIAIEWQNGELVSTSVKSLVGNKLNLRYNGNLISQETKKGETLSFTLADFNN